jgi:hypothetical protein
VGDIAKRGTINKLGVRHWLKSFRLRGALNAAATLRRHWPKYLMEAGGLGSDTFFACTFATLLQHADLKKTKSMQSKH